MAYWTAATHFEIQDIWIFGNIFIDTKCLPKEKRLKSIKSSPTSLIFHLIKGYQRLQFLTFDLNLVPRMHSNRMPTARSLPHDGVYFWGVLLTRDPLDKDLPRQQCPQTETPWTETPAPGHRPQPLNTDPSGQRPRGHVTCGSCWDSGPCVNRITDRCKNITLPQLLSMQ